MRSARQKIFHNKASERKRRDAEEEKKKKKLRLMQKAEQKSKRNWDSGERRIQLNRYKNIRERGWMGSEKEREDRKALRTKPFAVFHYFYWYFFSVSLLVFALLFLYGLPEIDLTYFLEKATHVPRSFSLSLRFLFRLCTFTRLFFCILPLSRSLPASLSIALLYFCTSF